jgi:hypothetical protein
MDWCRAALNLVLWKFASVKWPTDIHSLGFASHIRELQSAYGCGGCCLPKCWQSIPTAELADREKRGSFLVLAQEFSTGGDGRTFNLGEVATEVDAASCR